MAYPYSRTVVEGIISAIDDIGQDTDDNTETLYVARYSPHLSDGGQRPSHILRVTRTGKEDIGGLWAVTLTIEIDSKFPIDTETGAESTDEQLDNAKHDLHRALSTAAASLNCNFTYVDSAVTYEEDPKDPVMGLISTTTWTYEVDSSTHAYNGPGGV